MEQTEVKQEKAGPFAVCDRHFHELFFMRPLVGKRLCWFLVVASLPGPLLRLRRPLVLSS